MASTCSVRWPIVLHDAFTTRTSSAIAATVCASWAALGPPSPPATAPPTALGPSARGAAAWPSPRESARSSAQQRALSAASASIAALTCDAVGSGFSRQPRVSSVAPSPNGPPLVEARQSDAVALDGRGVLYSREASGKKAGSPAAAHVSIHVSSSERAGAAVSMAAGSADEMPSRQRREGSRARRGAAGSRAHAMARGGVRARRCGTSTASARDACDPSMAPASTHGARVQRRG